jgi:hypothetical protein
MTTHDRFKVRKRVTASWANWRASNVLRNQIEASLLREPTFAYRHSTAGLPGRKDLTCPESDWEVAFALYY